MMTENTDPVKLLAVIRRRPGLTKREFFDYHFQQHGRISEAPTSQGTPWKYYQTHFFDGVFAIPSAQPDAPLNANYRFSFVDDMTELYFSDISHLKEVMSSDYVKNVIGPDGKHFNDFTAANAILATVENCIYGNTEIEDSVTTADYFVLLRTSPESGTEAKERLGSALIEAIKQHDEGQIYRLDVTARLPDPGGIVKYFGAGDPDKPRYTLVFKMYMKSASGVSTVRKIQKAFEAAVGTQIDSDASMVMFGKRGLVLDQARNIRFDPSRQPVI